MCFLKKRAGREDYLLLLPALAIAGDDLAACQNDASGIATDVPIGRIWFDGITPMEVVERREISTDGDVRTVCTYKHISWRVIAAFIALVVNAIAFAVEARRSGWSSYSILTTATILTAGVIGAVVVPPSIGASSAMIVVLLLLVLAFTALVAWSNRPMNMNIFWTMFIIGLGNLLMAHVLPEQVLAYQCGVIIALVYIVNSVASGRAQNQEV